MLVLGLVWQLMRAYTLSLLRKLKPDGTPIAEKDILAWANKKLSNAGKEPIKSFQVSHPSSKYSFLKFRWQFCVHTSTLA